MIGMKGVIKRCYKTIAVLSFFCYDLSTMSVQEMIDYWKKSAAEDIITAEGLFRIGRYLPCLFYCHLFVEKILKAMVVKDTGKPLP